MFKATCMFNCAKKFQQNDFKIDQFALALVFGLFNFEAIKL